MMMMVMMKTDKTDEKKKLLKMVDESSFVWKTAAAEIVQLLHEERSKGGELVEIYADKVRTRYCAAGRTQSTSL